MEPKGMPRLATKPPSLFLGQPPRAPTVLLTIVESKAGVQNGQSKKDRPRQSPSLPECHLPDVRLLDSAE